MQSFLNGKTSKISMTREQMQRLQALFVMLPKATQTKVVKAHRCLNCESLKDFILSNTSEYSNCLFLGDSERPMLAMRFSCQLSDQQFINYLAQTKVSSSSWKKNQFALKKNKNKSVVTFLCKLIFCQYARLFPLTFNTAADTTISK